LQPDALGQQIVEPVHEVVAGDDGDLEAGDAALAGVLDDGLGAGRRVDAAGVRDHLEPLLPDVRQQLRDDLDEVAGVAGAGVAEALLLEDGHGDLGEVVHHEVVDGPLAGLVEGGALEVAPEALAGGDADGVFHENGRDGRGLEDTGWTAPSYLGSPLPPPLRCAPPSSTSPWWGSPCWASSASSGPGAGWRHRRRSAARGRWRRHRTPTAARRPRSSASRSRGGGRRWRWGPRQRRPRWTGAGSARAGRWPCEAAPAGAGASRLRGRVRPCPRRSWGGWCRRG